MSRLQLLNPLAPQLMEGLQEKPGVCFSTLGPGATNLVTGVAQAQLTGAPFISISGQKALIDNWQARFQLVDVVRNDGTAL